MQYKVLRTTDKHYLAYSKINGKINEPEIVFFGGLASNMEGAKATALARFCSNNKLSFLRFDYFGHGKSSGEFTDGTISIWLQNCLQVLDELTSGKQIIVGSSIGGWLMLLAALQRPQRIHSLIGIAAAPDFTEELITQKLSNVEKEELQCNGVIKVLSNEGDYSYKFSKKLLEDARNYLLLSKKTIPVNCPIHLLHGMSDIAVPYNFSLRIAQKLASRNVVVNLLKTATHSMSDTISLKLLFEVITKHLAMKYEVSV